MAQFTLFPQGPCFWYQSVQPHSNPLRDSGYCSWGDPSHPPNLNCGLCKPKIGTLSPCHLRIVSTELWVLPPVSLLETGIKETSLTGWGLDRDTRLTPLLEHTQFLSEEERDLYIVPSVLPVEVQVSKAPKRVRLTRSGSFFVLITL